MPVSIVIVNYNTKELLLSCVDSIYAFHVSDQFEIIIVDNDSSDGSVEAIRHNYPNLKVLVNERNVGFGAANNRGINEAIYEYILLLNSDTIIEHNILSELESFAERSDKFAGVTPQILFPDKTPQNSFGNYPSVFYFFLNACGLIRVLSSNLKRKYSIGLEYNSMEPTIVPHILGVAMFLRKDVFVEVGGFDEKYFLYFEETDLCYRITQKGYKFYINPKVFVLHFLSKSSPSSTFKTYHMMRSRIYYFKKNIKSGIWVIKLITKIKLFTLFVRFGDKEYLKMYNKITK